MSLDHVAAVTGRTCIDRSCWIKGEDSQTAESSKVRTDDREVIKRGHWEAIFNFWINSPSSAASAEARAALHCTSPASAVASREGRANPRDATAGLPHLTAPTVGEGKGRLNCRARRCGPPFLARLGRFGAGLLSEDKRRRRIEPRKPLALTNYNSLADI